MIGNWNAQIKHWLSEMEGNKIRKSLVKHLHKCVLILKIGRKVDR